MGLIQVTGPAAEPLSLTEVKNHLRVDDTDSDALITALIAAARREAEAITRRSLVLQTWDYALDDWPRDEIIVLPKSPLRGVVSISYVAPDGVAQTLAASDYTVDRASDPARIVPAYGTAFPAVRDHVNSIAVRVKVGYAVRVTANDSTDVLTAVGHTHAAGDPVRLYNSGGALPAGLAAMTDYYVRDVVGDTFKLAATAGGAAIDITGTGTGTHYLGEVPENIRHAMLMMIAHWFENREAVIVGESASELPFAVQALLSAESSINYL